MIELIPTDLPVEAPEVIGAFWNFVIQLGISLILQLVSAATRKPPKPPQAAGLDDFEPTGREIGSTVQAVGGAEEIEPVVLWRGDLRVTKIYAEGGGKK